jgi:hypothetical protein
VGWRRFLAVPSWGDPKRVKGGFYVSPTSLVAAVRSPRAAVGLGARLFASRFGFTAMLPFIGMFLPSIISLVESVVKQYVEAEMRRKYEQLKKEFYEEVYGDLRKELNKIDRDEYRQGVPE